MPAVRWSLALLVLGSQVATADVGPFATRLRVAGDGRAASRAVHAESIVAALAKDEIALEYVDIADPDARMEALAKGEVDLVVATVDAYLASGSRHGFPGAIVWNLAESNGGDAIFLGRGKRNFDDFTARDAVCFAAGTPSQHLWDYASATFAHLAHVRIDGEGGCLDKLASGAVQAAVLAQPQVASATQDGFRKILATGGGADDVVVDVLVAGREVARRPIAALARAYFSAPAASPEAMTYDQNMQLWWGKKGKMPGQLRRTAALLVEADRLPASTAIDPDVMLDRTFLDGLARGVEPVAEPSYDYDASGHRDDAARTVGTVRVPAVSFGEGSSSLDATAAQVVRTAIAERLRGSPGLCVHVWGHTARSGDPSSNHVLSRQRAGAIAARLADEDPKLFPAKRFDVRGFGGERDHDELLDRRLEIVLFECGR